MKMLIFAFLIVMLQSCFPSFAPAEVIKKELKQGYISLKWIDVIGTLDQNFPDYISIQKGKQIEILCSSHNIADLRINKNTITIGFYGIPKKHTKPILVPKDVLEYEIKIDTNFVKD
jgi:hypothetical protein